MFEARDGIEKIRSTIKAVLMTNSLKTSPPRCFCLHCFLPFYQLANIAYSVNNVLNYYQELYTPARFTDIEFFESFKQIVSEQKSQQSQEIQKQDHITDMYESICVDTSKDLVVELISQNIALVVNYIKVKDKYND